MRPMATGALHESPFWLKPQSADPTEGLAGPSADPRRGSTSSHFAKNGKRTTTSPPGRSSTKRPKFQTPKKNGKHIAIPCDICGHQFTRGTAMQRHKDTVHADSGRFVCDFEGCRKGFTRKDTLIRHKGTRHSSSAKKKCTQCGAMVRTDGLGAHKQTQRCISKAIQAKSKQRQRCTPMSTDEEPSLTDDESTPSTGRTPGSHRGDLKPKSVYILELMPPEKTSSTPHNNRFWPYSPSDGALWERGNGAQGPQNPSPRSWIPHPQNENPYSVHQGDTNHQAVIWYNADRRFTVIDKDPPHKRWSISESMPQLIPDGPRYLCSGLVADDVLISWDNEDVFMDLEPLRSELREGQNLFQTTFENSAIVTSVERSIRDELERLSSQLFSTPISQRDQCPICKTSLPRNIDDMFEHAKHHFLNPPKPCHPCPGCDLEFVYQSDLENHRVHRRGNLRCLECLEMTMEGNSQWKGDYFRDQFVRDLRLWEKLRLFYFLDEVDGLLKQSLKNQNNEPSRESAGASIPQNRASDIFTRWSVMSFQSCRGSISWTGKQDVDALTLGLGELNV